MYLSICMYMKLYVYVSIYESRVAASQMLELQASSITGAFLIRLLLVVSGLTHVTQIGVHLGQRST